MKTRLRSLVVAIVFVAVAIAAFAYFASMGNSYKPVAFEVNNKTYNITAYAYTMKQQERGLMNSTVTNATFMLFYFGKPGIYSFWMKDTYSQLDIIWLNYSPSTGTAKVVYAVNATPCIDYSKNQDNCTVYTPTGYANYVIETKSGFIEQNMVKTGTDIKFLTK